MDRVFNHLQYVRCPTCSRVFCCTKHRVEHQRRVHVAVPGGQVIRRRFRSSQVLPQSGKHQMVHAGGHSTNGRKRLHGMASTSTTVQSIGSGLRLMEQRHHRRVEELRRTEELRCTEELRRTEERRWTVEQRAAMIEMCARTILKARRSSLTTIRHLRPVAESSPVVPLPQPCTPHTTCTDAAESATTPVEWSVVVSSVGSPPSFYQTPMQTPTQTPTQMFQDTPLVQKLPDNQLQKLPDTQLQKLSDTPLQGLSNMPLKTLSDTQLQKLSDTPLQGLSNMPLQTLSDTPLQTLSDTPVKGKPRCNGESVKRVSSDDGPTQKGFFWSNMARRFRWALRSTKPKVRENGYCPSPSAAANLDYVMVNPYGNIKPRRPICNNDTLTTPVHARPSLEAIRKAHEEASKAFNKFMTD